MSDKNAKNQVLVQGTILAAASLIVRFIGLLYRIPMTRIIGEAGIGYYSTAFQVYNVVLLLSSYSMPQALSKLMAARLGKRQYRNANRYFFCSLAVSVLSGLIFSSIMYFGSGFIAGTLLHAELAQYSLQVLAPTVFVMSFLGVFRGYFQGLHTMVPTAISQIIEQIINAVVSIIGAWVLFNKGLRVDYVKGDTDFASALGAKGGTYGTLWGAVAALIFMIFMFGLFYGDLKKKMAREPKTRVFAYPRVFKEIYSMVIPIVISTFIFHVLNIIDNGIYNSFMRGAEVDEYTYMSIWGVYSGKYQLLINLPIALATAMASSIIPQLTAAVEKRDLNDVHTKIDVSLRFTTLITIPAMIGMMVLGGDVIRLLFGSGESAADGGKMMVIGGVAVILFAYATISNGILHGLGRMYSTVKNALIALAVHLVSLVLLLWVFRAGIYGVVISYIIFGLVVSVLNYFTIYNYTNYKGSVMKTYVLPLAASVIMGFIVYGINFIVKQAIGAIIKIEAVYLCFGIIASITLGVFIYFIVAIALKAADEQDLKNMPMGTKLLGFAKKFRLL